MNFILKSSFCLLFYLLINLCQAQTLIASYPLKGGPEDVSLRHAPMRCYEGGFVEDGLQTEGIYTKNFITTPPITELDFDKFTISVDFKAAEIKSMPVFVLGRSCRLLSFRLFDDGTIGFNGNNGDVKSKSTLKYQTGKWYTATIIYENEIATIYFGDQQIGKEKVVFSHDCMNTYFYGNQDISTTDYGNAASFKGVWRNMKIYNGVSIPSKIAQQTDLSEKIDVVWLSPARNENTKLTHFEVKASVVSKQIIKGIKLYNNNHLMESLVLNNENIKKYDFKKTISLHNGSNNLMLHVLTSGYDQKANTTITHLVTDSDETSSINDKLITAKISEMNSLPKSDLNYLPVMTPAPDNGSYITRKEKDSGVLKVDRLDINGKVLNTVTIGTSYEAYAIVADKEGFALLLDQKGTEGKHKDVQWLYFARYSENGQKLVFTKLVGDLDFEKTGNMGSCPYWSTPRIVFNGTYYYAVFGVFKKWDDGVVHQGDYLAIIDQSGNQVKPENTTHGWSVAVQGWSWGYSHSFDQRLALDQNYVHVLAKGDSYPRGIGYRRILHNMTKTNPKTVQKTIQPISDNKNPDEIYQFVPANLGDIVPTGDGEVLTSYASREGRSSFDLALNFVNFDGEFTEKWLTNTPNEDEHNVYMSAYGDNYLLIWTTQTKNTASPSDVLPEYKAAIIDIDGDFIVKPFILNAKVQMRSQFWASDWYAYSKAYGNTGGITNDLQTYPNGDIGWIYTDRQTGNIELSRIPLK